MSAEADTTAADAYRKLTPERRSGARRRARRIGSAGMVLLASSVPMIIAAIWTSAHLSWALTAALALALGWCALVLAGTMQRGARMVDAESVEG